jgi:ABC-type lipoprotein export system ATPase subunit
MGCSQPASTVAAMPVLQAASLVKTHGTGRAARRILDGASLELHAGELVAVVGRSGSGKSTLLHLLGALDRPDSGEIAVAGRVLGELAERELVAVRRDLIGLVFQFFHLVPELSGLENVLLPARLPGGPANGDARARELIAQLGVAEAAQRRPHQLSGGEQQRLALARALVRDPPLLLADEPTGNLDEASGRMVLGLLRDAADAGHAVLVVTHEQAATDIADRVLQLQNGRLVA